MSGQTAETTELGAAEAAPLLNVNNIEVIYDHVILVLKGVSLQLQKGGITALLGANGAGKTTVLNLMIEKIARHTGSLRRRANK